MRRKRPFVPTYRLLLAVILVVLMGTVGIVNAQEPIALDEIKPGAISPANPLPSFDFVASPGQNIEIEVLAISEGMVPQFVVQLENNALGVWYALAPQNSVKSSVALTEGGTYRIVVGTTNGVQGQFVITVREVIPPPTLVIGAPTSGPLADGDSITYLLEAGPTNRLALAVTGESIAADLYDADGNLVGSLTNNLAGGGFYLPGGSGAYSIEVRDATPDTAAAAYQLSLTVSN